MLYSLAVGKGEQPIAKIYTPKEVDEHQDDEPEEKIKKRSKKAPTKPPKNSLYLNKMDFNSPDRTKEYIITGKQKLKPFNIRQVDGHANRIFCAGGTLSGKSFMAGKLAKSYQKYHPKSKVVLFSWVEKDKAYDKLKNLHKIRIDETILDDPIDLGELQDSICIFDDIEHFTNPHIVKELERLRDSCVNAGRHKNIDCIVARQNLLEGVKTKTSLNSCFQVIAFPHSAGRFQLSEWLRRYMSLDKIMIQKILNVPSRWVLVNRSTPPYVLHEKGCFLLA